MFLQPLDGPLHCWEPQGPGLLRRHAVVVGKAAFVTADLVVPGMPTRKEIERRRQLAPHAVLVAGDLFLVTIATAATDEDNSPRGRSAAGRGGQVLQLLLELGCGPPGVHDLAVRCLLDDQGELGQFLGRGRKNRTDAASAGKQEAGLKQKNGAAEPGRRTHSKCTYSKEGQACALSVEGCEGPAAVVSK